MERDPLPGEVFKTHLGFFQDGQRDDYAFQGLEHIAHTLQVLEDSGGKQ